MSNSIHSDHQHVNTLYKTSMSLLARGYTVVAVAADKRPVARWEPLMAPNPSRQAVDLHLQALASGEAPALGIVNGVNNIVCIDIDAVNRFFGRAKGKVIVDGMQQPTTKRTRCAVAPAHLADSLSEKGFTT